MNLLESKEFQRIEKGEPTSLTTIAEVWAERRINVGLASYIEVLSLAKQLSRQLQRLVRDGKLMVYEAFLQRERLYEAEDEPDLASGRILLLPRNVNAWMEKERLSPTLTTPNITPPEGWKAQSPQGLQRSNETDEGRLVRLADLVQWLMDVRELPCKGAVEMVCSVFEKHPSPAGRWLYLLSESGYAQLLPWDHSFFYLPIVDLSEPYPTGEVADKGVLGAVKYLREYWGESSAPGNGGWCGQHVLDPLAMHMEVAHWLWGYGSRKVEVEQQVTTPKKETPAERGNRWLTMYEKEQGLEKRGALQRIADAEGVDRSNMSKQIKKAEKLRAENRRAGPWDSQRVTDGRRTP